ncbi:hypothetical protein D3Y57_05720 [Sphingomonas paeninsulae]|uniref:Uncharacterized protein n=1 Tax=Sphingomonas paeninsulae TaxID=2319844 RepID=A0A494TJI5_SPHPE|nr:hypothetical protein D3Y57_05720 [Sphingomonas paeninsulae]
MAAHLDAGRDMDAPDNRQHGAASDRASSCLPISYATIMSRTVADAGWCAVELFVYRADIKNSNEILAELRRDPLVLS